MRLDPDLVVTPASARADVTSLLRHAGLPVYRMYTMFETLASIEEHIRLIGYLTGEDARADERGPPLPVDAIARAAARRPAGAGRTRGARSRRDLQLRLEDALRRHPPCARRRERGGAAWTCRLRPHHRRAHRALESRVDRRRRRSRRGSKPRARACCANPAIAATRAAQDGHVLVLENQVFLPLSPFTAQLVEALSEALYGGRRRDAAIRSPDLAGAVLRPHDAVAARRRRWPA